VIRSIIFAVWIYVSMLLLALVTLPFFLFSRWIALETVRLWMKNVRFSLRWILGIETEIRGRENVPKGALLYASKHQTMYDAFFPFLILDDPAVIIKQELLWYPIFGWYAWRTDMIPIKRGGGAKTFENMYAEARKRTDKGHQVLIFPEGTRKLPGAPPAYKTGVKAWVCRACPSPTMLGFAGQGAASGGDPAKLSSSVCPYFPPGWEKKSLWLSSKGR
jgi:1-acyl-sn-glycerol-3-phosphate acyltransferase